MRKFTLIVALVLPTASVASTPYGERHGAWHVVSGSDEEDGGSSLITINQKVGDDEIAVLWMRGDLIGATGNWVNVKIRINDCLGDDEDLAQHYTVNVQRWLRQSDEQSGARLRQDFSTWLAQARLACTNSDTPARFDLDHIEAAARDFDARLAELARVARNSETQ